jgi:hypothetical protein
VQRLIAFGLLIAISAMSPLPAPWKGRFATRGPLHSLEHVFAFCALYLLFSDRQSDWRVYSAAAIAVFACGLMLEALQTRVYRIPIESADVLYDALGVTLGLLAKFCTRIRPSS